MILKMEVATEIMGTLVKKKEVKKTEGLIDFVFSWSLADVLNKDLYKHEVKKIPKTFSSADEYFESFITPLLEETHADLRSNMSTLSNSPSCEVYSVRWTNELNYRLSLRPGSYEPQCGDLIALTEVKPKCIDDLNRPRRTYTLGLIQNEAFPTITILSSKEILFERTNKENGAARDKICAVYLTNLTTNMRIWYALHAGTNVGNMKIINSVLGSNSSVEENCSLCLFNGIESTNLSKSRHAIHSFGLDDSQKSAVLNSIGATDCPHLNSVKLIWGPPGTGKTKTVAALLYALLKMKCRTLTCAPTNVAVLGVTKRLMSLLRGMLIHETYGLGDIVLFGNGERMKIDDHDDLSDIFLKNRIGALANCFAPITGWSGSLESLVCLLEDPNYLYLRYLEQQTKENEKRDVIAKKKKKQKNKKRPQEKYQSECDMKDKTGGRKIEASENENIPWTFKQFFTRKFHEISDCLISCCTRLYTHMPTSYLPKTVADNMVKAHDLLKTLQALLTKFDISKGHLLEFLTTNEGMHSAKQASSLYCIRLQCLEVLKLLRGTFSVPKFSEPYKISSFCLKNAPLIFCTASSSAKLYTVGMKPFELVIIDEAAQIKECESCIPLQLSGVRHAILVGDEKQLPAMIQSKICEKAEFGRSLFERLVILGHSKHLLNVQYRMHPSISSFPNREFYNGEITNGQNVMKTAHERKYLAGKMFGSYSFIDINNGKEEFDDRHSRKNIVEVHVIAEILSKLYRESLCSEQRVRVGCISPYKSQVVAIQERLGNTYSKDVNDKFSVNVRSVDGFQGGEEDVIIISTVRCNRSGSIGFLSNFQRVNVALTRARHCLWILGNSATLVKSGTIWKDLVLDAKSRDCFYKACEVTSLPIAKNRAIGQRNTLFTTDSILFRNSKWKLRFSTQFQESMLRQEMLGIHETVAALLVKLSNGWRESSKDDGLAKTEDASSQLLESCDVKENLKLIWTVDIIREGSTDIQVIKVWDILPGSEVPKLAKGLDVISGNYTVKDKSRCAFKWIKGKLTIPATWLVDENDNSIKNASHELANKLTKLSIKDELGPGSSTTRKFGKKSYRRRRKT